MQAAPSGDLWLCAKGKDGKFVWRNRIPLAIVEIFERDGFIWGGKWYHFDSFILNIARRSSHSPSAAGRASEMLGLDAEKAVELRSVTLSLVPTMRFVRGFFQTFVTLRACSARRAKRAHWRLKAS